jgi:hypothetical protein
MRPPADTIDVAGMRLACRRAAGELLVAHRVLAGRLPSHLLQTLQADAAAGVAAIRRYTDDCQARRRHLAGIFQQKCRILADALEESGAIGEAAAARADWRLEMARHDKRSTVMWWSVEPTFPEAAGRFIGHYGIGDLLWKPYDLPGTKTRRCLAINRGPLVIFRPRTVRITRWVKGPELTFRLRFTHQKQRGRSFLLDDQVAPGGFYSLFHAFPEPEPPASLFPELEARPP